MFCCTIAFNPEMNDNWLDSFRKADQNFKSFSETAQKLKLQNADYQRYFQKKTKKSCKRWWNFPAFGIEKNGPTWADFEACPKFVFSSFKTQNFLAFLKNWQTFLVQIFFFDTPHFFSSKIKKNTIFWYSIFVKKIRFTGGNSILNSMVETISSFRPVSKKRPETVWNCQSFTETGWKKKAFLAKTR